LKTSLIRQWIALVLIIKHAAATNVKYTHSQTGPTAKWPQLRKNAIHAHEPKPTGHGLRVSNAPTIVHEHRTAVDLPSHP